MAISIKPHGNAKLTVSDVQEIRVLKGKRSERNAAREYFVGRTTIRDIWSGKTWRKL